MVRSIALALLATGSLLAAGKFPEGPAGGSGVNIHFTDARPGELEMLRAGGFRHVRMDFSWGATEKQKGVYDFSAYDRLMASLEKHGLKAYFILDYGNRLYGEERAVKTDEGREALSKWAAAVRNSR